MKTKIIEELKKTLIKAGAEPELINLEHPVDNKFGDYATSVAMAIAKKEKKNPAEVARELKIKLDEIADKTGLIDKIEVVGGFINFYLKIEYLIREVEKLNYEIEFRNILAEYYQGKTVVIDYSAPNIAKPFGIGHLRSTNIGQAIYNIFKILGWNCIGDNHLGDWGTQFGKLIVAIRRWGSAKQNESAKHPAEQDLQNLGEMTIEDLEKLYVRFHTEAEKDESLIEEGRKCFEKLEKGDKEAREIWQKCVDISLLEFDRVYRLLDVQIDVAHGESFYIKMLPKVIDEVKKKGIAKESQGALIVEFEGMPPAMVLKSNGTTTYLTRDLATIKYRLRQWKPDLIIYEVGADQSLYFRQLFAIAEMMGWLRKDQLVHVAHGLMRWKEGKFSTRKGDTIHLSEVIERARTEAEKIAKKGEIDKGLTATEKAEMVEKVAIGAIKFSDLAADPRKDVVFEWERVMSLEGNSGPYLQYTFARCQSVLSKTKIKEQKNIGELPEKINTEEMALMQELAKMEEKILESAERYSGAVIAEHLLSVARKYNEFYAKHRILEQKEEVFRIFLTKATASALHLGLELLGIKTVEKM